MADDSGLGLIVAAIIDIVLGESGKRHKWVRVLNYVGSLLLFLLLVLLVYVTIKYS